MAKNNWSLDASHSSVDFSIRHLMISKVKGSFKEFSAEVVADENDITDADISFVIQVASVDTRNPDRDNHLRSGDFFEVEKYPTMSFKSTEIKKISKGEYSVTGDFTIRDVTRTETFLVTYEGSSKDPWGGERAGFAVEGKIKRSNFGLTYNAALETGGVLIGDDVKIYVEIQAVKA